MKTQTITFGSYKQLAFNPTIRKNIYELGNLAALNPKAYPNLIKVSKSSKIKKTTSNVLDSLIDKFKTQPGFKDFESGFLNVVEKLKEKTLTLSDKVKFLDFFEEASKTIIEKSL